MNVIIPFCNADKARAERLLDSIYWLAGQKAHGHCVLVPASDVHAEFRAKCTIAAELAFNSVTIVGPPKIDGAKNQQINNAFQAASEFIWKTFRDPWLWLEADCVPLKKTWLQDLFAAYSHQPRRYFGRHMQAKAGIFMNRVGIYPPDAFVDVGAKCSGVVPFERVAGVVSRSTNTRLISVERWLPENSIPGDAVLLNSDKSGKLIEDIMEACPAVANRIAKPQLTAK